MSDQYLLLSFRANGRTPRTQNNFAWWEIAAMAVGVFVVLVGAADVTSRLAHDFLGNDASMAFAPVAALGDPSILANLSGSPQDTPTTPIVSPTSTQTASTTSFIPARLKIPAINVNAAVQQVGKNAAGSMGTPTNFTDVAWYMLGSKPGEAGSVVIDGHVNNAKGTDGVFANLVQVKLGDYITVEDSAGHSIIYIVTETDEYNTDAAPLDTIFATTGPAQLVLITCDGDWIPSAHSYNKRLVVVARPAY
jgi:LPXTG-site transpeptidase (sortase) family protein